MDEIKIFISGDFAPRHRAYEVIKNKDFSLLFGDVLPYIKQADISITNLESPLIDEGNPIPKTGPNLKSPTDSIEALKYAGFDMVTLANNHMMDFGVEGLNSTISICEKNGIRCIGAGPNITEASKVCYIDKKGKTIAFINCCENEWSTTAGDRPGCNPLNEVNIYYQIQEAKANADFVILIIHGGHETYELPSPRMKQLYRWFIDLGVDAVIGHHTHCYSGSEIYKRKPIVYSLGNFIFDSNIRDASWNYGVFAILSLSDDEIKVELYPFEQCNKKVGVFLLSRSETETWRNTNEKKTRLINDDILLSEKFDAFCKKNERQYRSYLEPNRNKYILAAKNRGWLKRNIRGNKARLYLNIIRAEAHRDVILQLLNTINEK